jgi:hypothetical protein
MSGTHCGRSVGFVRTAWEAVLGLPVDVALLSSAISGSSECRFRITPAPRVFGEPDTEG